MRFGTSVPHYIKAGAVAVAVGSNPVERKVVKEGRWEVLTDSARRFIEKEERS